MILTLDVKMGKPYSGTEINDVKTELMIVGSLFLSPDLFLDYGRYINSEDFDYPLSKFLFNSAYDMYYNYKMEKFTDNQVNYYMTLDEKRKKYYKFIDDEDILFRVKEVVEIDDFSIYYKNLKKYTFLRKLNNYHFPIKKIMENDQFSKMTPEQIAQSLEYKLHSIADDINCMEDSVILGNDIDESYKKWKEEPDLGYEIPFEILNIIMRGSRTKKLNMLGLHSGEGKSRIISKILCYISIKNQVSSLLCVNEQDKEEWDGMILSCVLNNPEFGFNADIPETNLVTGTVPEEKEEIVEEAIQYIKENSRIHFIMLNEFDEKSIKRQAKRHRIKGCKMMVYDTLKSPENNWEAFVRTAQVLKSIANDLDLSVWATFQLTDDSLFEEMLTSKAIAKGKHIKHEADFLAMARPLLQNEFDKYEIYMPISEDYKKIEGEVSGEEVVIPDRNLKYYIMFIDKNRGGQDKTKVAIVGDKSKNYWKEEGYFSLSRDEKERRKIKKQKKDLKEKKEVGRLKEEVLRGEGSEEGGV